MKSKKLVALKIKYFLLGLTCSILFISCAGWKYKYYVVSPDDSGSLSGKMLAKDQKDDLDLNKTCSPDDSSKGKCIAMTLDQFERLRTDYAEMQEMLNHCKGGQ